LNPDCLETLARVTFSMGHSRRWRYRQRYNDSLMARLDRLGPAKEVAQIGACIGREFDHELLAAVVPPPEAGLAAALDRLVAAELVYRRGIPPATTLHL